jgi:ABC-type nitrate/sulfonate/bicarbonate transport system substrate-binding protein
MSTLATCPDWCTWGHILDPGENSHDGPSWATVGDRGDDDQASVSVGQGEGQPILVLLCAGSDAANLTPEQAREVARGLYKAASWAEDQPTA